MSQQSELGNAQFFLENKLTEFKVLFTEPESREFIALLAQLDTYYRNRATRAPDYANKKTVIEEYQFLINTIKEVQEGSLTADLALSQIKLLSSNRKMALVIENILRVCEVLFWLSTLTTAFVFCLGLGVPLMFFNPPLGLSISLGTCLLGIQAGIHALECMNQLKTFTEVNQQEQVERNLLSFFSASKPNPREEQEEVYCEI